jgi:hypothetical protein
MANTYSIVEPAGESWQIATINATVCKGLRAREHPGLVKMAWVRAGIQPDDTANPPAALVGKLVLLDLPAPTVTEGKKLSPELDQPVVDVEAATATWFLLTDMTEQEIADKAEADAAAARAALKAQAATRRWDIETGGITRNGAAIATDQVSQSKIGGALQLVQADPQLVIRWKGLDGWVGMDAATVTYVAEQIGLHVQAAFAREEAICLAIDADTPVNILTGAIDGVGAWPT